MEQNNADVKIKDEESSKEEDELVEEGNKKFKKWKESEPHKKLLENSETNIKYFTGEDQGWDEKGDRSALEQSKRPALTMNKVAPIIRLICGARPKVKAGFFATSDDDLQKAPIFNACKIHVDETNDWDTLSDEIFKHALIINRSVIYIHPDYDKDIRGEIGLEFKDGLKVVLDPNSRKKDYSDAEGLFIEDWVSVEELKRDYPEKAEEIEQLSKSAESSSNISSGKTVDTNKNDRYNDVSTWWNQVEGKIKVITWWYKQYEKYVKVIDQVTGEVYDAQGDEKETKNKIVQASNEPDRFIVKAMPYTKVCYLMFINDLVLEQGLTPWERQDGRQTELSKNFPFIIFEPDRIYAGTRNELINIIDPLKDAQRYFNKLVSLVLEILGTQASSGWLREKGALTPEGVEALKKYGSTPGVDIEVTKNALGENRIRRIETPNPPSGPITEARELSNEIVSIAGVESLISTQSLGKDASGFAIDLKQRQGGNIIAWVYASFRSFDHRLARFELDAMQVIYNYEKVIRIRGNNPRYVKINEEVYDEKGEITEIMNDVTIGDFDIVIDDKEILPTMRIERFKYFSEMVKSGQLVLPPEVMNKIVFALMDDPELKQIVEEELGNFTAAMQQPPPGGVASPQLPEQILTS